MATKKKTTALSWIIDEAKRLKKNYPKRFSTWKEYVAQASAIYASKHKGKSPVGKNKIAAPAKVKKTANKPKIKKTLIKKVLVKAKAKKTPSRSTHKDTKSHNVNIRVVSGYKQTPEIILGKMGSVTLLKSLAPEVKLRITRGKKVTTNKITSALDVSDILKKFLTPSKIQTQEYALAMFLNNNNNVLGIYQFGMGGFTATIMDKRLLMAAALKLGATSIILCHNHPSGKLDPSKADIEITRDIAKLATIHDMKVLDHVILTKNGYYSFADNGLI